MCAWKSHIGVALSSDRKIVRATATGWGRSGALTDALLTRTGSTIGFLAALPQNTASLFIGFSNLSGSLYDHSRAHQEDLDFSMRTSSSGELSYQSKARMMQYAYSPHLESDTVCEVQKGDVIGMRLTPDRRGIQIVKEEEDTTEDANATAAAHDPSATGEAGKGEAATTTPSSDAATVTATAAPGTTAAAAAAATATTKKMRLRVLKTIPEVSSVTLALALALTLTLPLPLPLPPTPYPLP